MQLLVLQIGADAFYNNVSLFPIVTVQAAFFCFTVGNIMCLSELDASS